MRRKSYSDALALRVASTYGELCALEDVVTISAIARRAGVSRASVRAVLRDTFDWTPMRSQAACQEGKRRGHTLQRVAGHPGLARGRKTLAAQGWPNLQQGHRTLSATGYAGLGRGRATQASDGWPVLQQEQRKRAAAGHPQLDRGRANLALRNWPNWARAHAVLAAQEYLPLLEGRLLTQRRVGRTEVDRRILRGRTTTLAILEALESVYGHAHDGVSGVEENGPRVSARELASRLQLHPTTVYAHLRQLRALGII